MNEYILVTGGAGYIGSIIVEILQNNGFKVIVIDNLSNGKKEALSEDVKFFKGDFADTLILNKIFNEYKINFVIHLAASANVPHSLIDPIQYYENNTSKTVTLLKKMKEKSVKNIIFSSTAAVYGEPVYTPIDETHPTIPINPYGHSKLMIEQIIKDCRKAFDLNYIIFRYLCVAGATELHGEARKNETHLIPLVINKIINNNSNLYVFGNDFNTIDGTGIRDYFHVLDIADAHILAINNINEVKNNIFNLGFEKGYSVLDIINFANDLFKVNIDFKIKQRREGDPAILVASTKNAEKKLGWKAKRTLNEILLSTYNWQKNPKY
ncbi:MAG: UDP-glucose 4-epimerase GalE [Bacteroidales bacterium]|nr:UDP-glucose 4-epimerase GalE [Bacteroidales bacterium]